MLDIARRPFDGFCVTSDGAKLPMKATPLYIALIASVVLAAPTLAQDKSSNTTDNKSVETSTKPDRMKRDPIDLAKFTNIDDLKAADTNKDGILSREEIETHALAQMVKRAADRMERRLDVNKDGKISLDAIEKQRAARFAELDTNKDGKLDRSELKAGNKHHKRGGHDGKHHGKRSHGEHKKADEPKKN